MVFLSFFFPFSFFTRIKVCEKWDLDVELKKEKNWKVKDTEREAFSRDT